LGGYGLRVVASTRPSMTLKFHFHQSKMKNGNCDRVKSASRQKRSREEQNWGQTINMTKRKIFDELMEGIAAIERTPPELQFGRGAAYSGDPRHWFIRHGENSGHARSTLAAHSVVLSVWQAVHESGIFADWAVAGAMKRKVWACTLTSAMVGWIFGMWQPTHSLPAEPGA